MGTDKPIEAPPIVWAAMARLGIPAEHLSRFYVSDTRVYLYLKDGDNKIVARSQLPARFKDSEQ